MKNFQLKITNCWSIINKKLASNAGHIHANSLISSAYYIKAKKNSGNLIFDDPRPAASIKKGVVGSPGIKTPIAPKPTNKSPTDIQKNLNKGLLTSLAT